MPWIAEYEGERKPPRKVPKGVDVDCPTCGGTMRVWGRSKDGKARHFKHIGNMGHGDGGGGGPNCETVAEHDIHKKWKSLAADQLENVFAGNIATCELEYRFDAPLSNKQHRSADAALLFETEDTQLHRGVAVEVQHKNESKDVEETTSDYLEQDISVVWLDEDDFSTDRCLLQEVDFRYRARLAVWPHRVPRAQKWRTDQNSYRRIQHRWQNAHRNGLTVSGAPATLPPDWVDETARDLWDLQEWDSLFRGERAERAILRGLLAGPPAPPLPRPAMATDIIDAVAQDFWSQRPWMSLFDTPPTAKYVMQGLAADSPSTELPAPRLPPEISDIVAKQIWHRAPWHRLFHDPEKYQNEIDAVNPGVTAEIDFAPWFSEEQWEEWWRRGAVRDNLKNAEVFIELGSNNSTRRCQDCNGPAEYNIIAKNVGKNGFYCSECLR